MTSHLASVIVRRSEVARFNLKPSENQVNMTQALHELENLKASNSF